MSIECLNKKDCFLLICSFCVCVCMSVSVCMSLSLSIFLSLSAFECVFLSVSVNGCESQSLSYIVFLRIKYIRITSQVMFAEKFDISLRVQPICCLFINENLLDKTPVIILMKSFSHVFMYILSSEDSTPPPVLRQSNQSQRLIFPPNVDAAKCSYTFL